VKCSNCNYVVPVGTEVLVGDRRQRSVHCPHCLQQLPHRSGGPSGDDEEPVSVRRFTLRRDTRQQFVDQQLRRSPDGRLHCPRCSKVLSKIEELILRTSEHFNCPHCAHDLAALAYSQVAFSHKRWTRVAEAVSEARQDRRCMACRCLGAMAMACQRALSHGPGDDPEVRALLATTLARADWHAADGDCFADCPPVRRYRELVGDVMLLL
jgi:hypothetical protein